MKISYDLEDKDTSGKHKFISRLRAALPKFGYFESKPLEADIHLYTTKPNKYAKYNILRLDGVWINSQQDCKPLNSKIINSVSKANGIVYQNEFCKEAAERVLKINHPNSVCILNGADPEEFTKAANGPGMIESHRPYFMAMCKWRPHKRLSDIVAGFLAANLYGVDLLVFGEDDGKIISDNIKYLGWYPKDYLNKHLVSPQCIGTVHLAWLDWCPNSVVESLVAGKQVIHTSSGGTPLVVKGRGYSVKDAEWNFKPLALYDPPPLDISSLAKAYQDSYNNPIKDFNISDLDIINVARQYSEFFNKIMKGGK